MRSLAGWGAVSVVCLVLASASAVAQEYRNGDQVVVISDAKLTVSGGKEVDDVWPGLVLRVQDINGKWLWLSNGKPGWLDQRHVIPLDRRAIDRLTQLIRQKPDNARLYNGRADVWQHLNELDLALGDYNEAIRIDPSAAYYNNRGLIWRAKQDYNKAISDFTESLRLDPHRARTFTNRGWAWLSKGDNDNVITDCTEAIRLDQKFTDAYNNRGVAWKNKGEYDIAIRDYDEAIRLDPKHKVAYGNRGEVWRLKGEYDKAIKDLTKALEVNPKFSWAYRTRGITRSAQQKYNDAIVDFSEAIRLDPKNSDNYYRRGIALAAQQKYSEAFVDYTEACRLDPKDVFSVIQGCLFARMAGNTARAEQFLKEAEGKLGTDWPHPVVQFLRGELNEPALLKLATDRGKETEARCYLALDHLANGRTEAARPHLQWVVDHGSPEYDEFGIARAELQRLSSQAGPSSSDKK